eukprot:5717464-Pyramimonas_sp.AAC.1
MVPIDNGDPMEIWVQHPFGWLEAASNESAYFSGLLRRTLDLSNNELDFYLHCDEVTPGNPLAEHNQRKVQCIYWAVICGIAKPNG